MYVVWEPDDEEEPNTVGPRRWNCVEADFPEEAALMFAEMLGNSGPIEAPEIDLRVRAQSGAEFVRWSFRVGIDWEPTYYTIKSEKQP